MVRKAIKSYAIVFAAWLPFFVVWVFITMSYAHYPVPLALLTSLISMGSASLLGIGAWHLCQRWPWPLQLNLKFYLLQLSFACVYSALWLLADYWLESMRRGTNVFQEIAKSQVLGWEFLTGIWLYGLFAGVSYAVQTRNRLHEKETL